MLVDGDWKLLTAAVPSLLDVYESVLLDLERIGVQVYEAAGF